MPSLLGVKSQSYVPCQNLYISFGHTRNAAVGSTFKVVFQAYGDCSLQTHLSRGGDRGRNGNSFLGLVILYTTKPNTFLAIPSVFMIGQLYSPIIVKHYIRVLTYQ
jgi:hypothetical protein